jgi:hypothetical protein
LLGDTLAALGKFKLVVLNRFPFSLSRPWRQWGADLPLHSFGEGGEPSAFRITLGSWGMHRSGWLRRSLEARRGAQVSGFDHTTKTLGKVSVEHWCGLSHAKPNIGIWAKGRGLLVNHKGARGGLDRLLVNHKGARGGLDRPFRASLIDEACGDGGGPRYLSL